MSAVAKSKFLSPADYRNIERAADFRSQLYRGDVRQADGTWNLKVFQGIKTRFSLDTVPIRVPMSEIYSGVHFESDR